MLLLDTNILIDVLRGEAVALAWLEQQQQPHISVITWIEVLVGCREGETSRVHDWLESFPRLPLNDAIAAERVRLRQQHGLKIPDAIILATAHGLQGNAHRWTDQKPIRQPFRRLRCVHQFTDQ